MLNGRPCAETASAVELCLEFRGSSCCSFSSKISSAVCLWSSVNTLLPTSPSISSSASSLHLRGTRTCSRYSSVTVLNPDTLQLDGQSNQTLAVSCITAGSPTFEYKSMLPRQEENLSVSQYNKVVITPTTLIHFYNIQCTEEIMKVILIRYTAGSRGHWFSCKYVKLGSPQLHYFCWDFLLVFILLKDPWKGSTPLIKLS